MVELTREILATGGTNPDYPATLAESIIAEVKKEQWDIGYMIQKARAIIEFLEQEKKVQDALTDYDARAEDGLEGDN